ncbi:hypothetical protein AGMMS49546_25700 [Spirochaetia bacterium]|nr:hypothetical protein AGMMS49546_25700 [Spirochaetia bacterium]
MFRKIPLLILIPCSLAAAALLLALGFVFTPPGEAGAYVFTPQAAYAELRTDESAPDREITDALSILSGGQVLSESSQWVFLDDFGELRQIPLDEYDQRLESFDPRNDGYAERVRSFFVRDGKRFFFIPLNRNFKGNRGFEKDIGVVLERLQPGLSWSLESRSRSRPQPLGLYLVLFVAAAITGLFFVKPRLLGAALFPVLGGLCLRGAPGFALAAILCLLGGLLLEPVRELCYSLGEGKSRSGPRLRQGESRSRLLRNSFGPYRFSWAAFPVLLALYGLAAFAGRVPLVLGTLSFLFFALIFFFFFVAEARRARAGDHIPFIPVLILTPSVKKFNFPQFMLPFALASCAALLFSVFLGGFSGLPGILALSGPEGGVPVTGTPPLIIPAEYQYHVEYQRDFSLLPLGWNGFDEAAYFHYDVDKDGLIGKARAEAGPGGTSRGIPPFPLESLMDFLGKPDSAAGRRGMGLFELVPVLLVLLLSIPALGGGQGKGKKKRPAIYNDKRIAA